MESSASKPDDSPRASANHPGQVPRPPTPLDPLCQPTTGAFTPEQGRVISDALTKLYGVTAQLPEPETQFVGAFELTVSQHALQMTLMPNPPVSRVGHLTGQWPSGAVQTAFRAVAPALSPVLQAVLTQSGIADYLIKRAPDLMGKGWEVILTVMPYFDRQILQVGMHKDTEGDNLFMLLLFANKVAIMGPEYILRPPLPDEYLPVMKANLPPAFVDDVLTILGDGMEPRIHFTRIPAGGGYVAACDELIFHSTPFNHHRGAYVVESLPEAVRWAAERYLDATDLQAYEAYPEPVIDQIIDRETLERRWDLFLAGLKQNPRISPKVREVLNFQGQLGKHGLRDPWVDVGVAKSWVSDPAWWALLEGFRTVTTDPYTAGGAIELDDDTRSVTPLPVRTGLTRSLSEELTKGPEGVVHPHPDFRDFLRVWIVARRRSPAPT